MNQVIINDVSVKNADSDARWLFPETTETVNCKSYFSIPISFIVVRPYFDKLGGTSIDNLIEQIKKIKRARDRSYSFHIRRTRTPTLLKSSQLYHLPQQDRLRRRWYLKMTLNLTIREASVKVRSVWKTSKHGSQRYNAITWKRLQSTGTSLDSRLMERSCVDSVRSIRPSLVAIWVSSTVSEPVGILRKE